jgi:delta24(24(1))-sterol reductase
MSKETKEFGGTPGAIGLMIFSHFVPFYFALSLRYKSGGLYFPSSFNELIQNFKETCSPTWLAFLLYTGFFLAQLILAAILPGPEVKGLPVPTENNRQYTYKCNALASWYLTLILVTIFHLTGIFRLTTLTEQFGSVLCVAVIFSDILSIWIHFYALKTNQTCRMTHSPIYDFFMGVWLNPRVRILGQDVDLKMIAEVRLSWLLLFLLIISAALKQYEVFHLITWPMLFILTAQLLYINACIKGEECIPVTWDIFYEKWGWMLIYWNLAGVPFVYAFQAYYILVNSLRTQKPTEGISMAFIIILFILLFLAYYVWDSSLSQKIRFRMQQQGICITRNAFPQVPWNVIKNPNYLKTACGSPLLIDGYWKYCRKPAYTADICMATLWGLSCYQWPGVLPYFYPVFFFCMIIHRYTRDMARCQAKYGKDWKIYCEQVPYAFIPGFI